MREKKKTDLYFITAFCTQLAVLGICILLHRVFISMGDAIQAAEQVGDEMSDPTSGRLAFVISCALSFFILSFFASRDAKQGKVFVPFVLGCFAGTFLWQCLGEDLWNFAVSGEHFVSLEDISVLGVAVLFAALLLYAWKNHSFDWGVWCVLLSFAVNWFGHYVLCGIYPFFAAVCSERLWFRAIGLVLGITLFASGIFFGFKKADTPKQKILAAILCYYAVAVLASGFMKS